MGENGHETETLSPGQAALKRFNSEIERARGLRNRVRLKFLGSAGLLGAAVSGAAYMAATGEVPNWAIAAEGVAAATSVILFGSAEMDLESLGEANRTAARLRDGLTVGQLNEAAVADGLVHPKELEAEQKLADFRARQPGPLE